MRPKKRKISAAAAENFLMFLKIFDEYASLP